MAKEVVAHIKLQIPAGQANPAPPVGTALGPRGVNIMAFCKEFNAATQKQAGDILPVVITVYKDKSFTFITKSRLDALTAEELAALVRRVLLARALAFLGGAFLRGLGPGGGGSLLGHRIGVE